MRTHRFLQCILLTATANGSSNTIAKFMANTFPGYMLHSAIYYVGVDILCYTLVLCSVLKLWRVCICVCCVKVAHFYVACRVYSSVSR